MEKVCTLPSKPALSLPKVVKVKIQQNFQNFILRNAELKVVPCESSAKEVSY